MKSTDIFFKLLFVIMILSLHTSSQEVLIDGELRPRSEYRQGFKRPIADSLSPAIVTIQRSRVNADYKSDVFNSRITLQEARIWGDGNRRVNSSKIELYEGWFEWFSHPSLSIKMGRQTIRYDDQRLIAAPNWSNTGMVHDIMLLKYMQKSLSVHAGLAYNNSKDTTIHTDYIYTNKQNYKALGYLWASKNFTNGFSTSIIGICDGFESKSDFRTVYSRYTYGGNLVFNSDSSRIGGTATVYLQSGKDPNVDFGTSYSDLSAYMFAIKIDYKITDKLKSKFGYDYYSGSSAEINQGTSNTFNRLYGAAHSYNGSMEYYVNIPKQGLIDYYTGIDYKISKKLRAECVFHLFSFAEDFVYQNSVSEKYLGSELDVLLNYNASKEVSVQFGVSKYFNSSSTDQYFKFVDLALHPQHWAYLMFTVKPQFYKSKI